MTQSGALQACPIACIVRPWAPTHLKVAEDGLVAQRKVVRLPHVAQLAQRLVAEAELGDAERNVARGRRLLCRAQGVVSSTTARHMVQLVCHIGDNGTKSQGACGASTCDKFCCTAQQGEDRLETRTGSHLILYSGLQSFQMQLEPTRARIAPLQHCPSAPQAALTGGRRTCRV